MQPNEARILVVDDDPALREVFAKWLGAVGCRRVEVAEDGAVALALLQVEHFDLLISDVRMPRVDGITLVRRLAEIGRTVPSIIFVSGSGDVDERAMYGQGVEAFLAKPLRMDEMIATIRRTLAERSLLWQTPLEPPPRQRLEAELPVDALRLGRGGFSLRYEPPLSLGKVSFAFHRVGEPPWLVGQGLVRWRSRADHRVGIEFVFLAEAGRQWVLMTMTGQHPRCFIPG